MLQITCLLWGDDPSQGFMVSLSPKDTIYNLKQKIVEYLELGNNISRKMKLIKLKEFITLDDIRLKQNLYPKELFACEELDKPFQILEDYFTKKDEKLKELPLDIIVIINNNNIPNAILDKKEAENVLMTPHKRITPIIRESTLVKNNSPFVINKKTIIDPSSFPSPPSFDIDIKGKNKYQTDLSNNDIDNMVPRTKSLIFDIDRFPSPPNDIENINNCNDNEPLMNNSLGSVKDKGKYTVCDIDQFPDAPESEDFSITSKIPLTYREEAPPSYDAISSNNIPSNRNNISRNNIYTNSSNINNPSYGEQNSFEYKKNKSKIIRRSIIISTCLCFGIIITTIIAIIVGKSLLQKREPMQSGKTQTLKIGTIKTYKNHLNQPATTINIATTTVKYVPTYTFNNFRTMEGPTLDSFVDVKTIYSDNSNITKLAWKMDMSENNPMTSINIQSAPNKPQVEKRNNYYDSGYSKYDLENKNVFGNIGNNDFMEKVQSDFIKHQNNNFDNFNNNENNNNIIDTNNIDPNKNNDNINNIDTNNNIDNNINNNNNNNNNSNNNNNNNINDDNNDDKNPDNGNDKFPKMGNTFPLPPPIFGNNNDFSFPPVNGNNDKNDGNQDSNNDKDKDEKNKNEENQIYSKVNIDNDLSLDLNVKLLRIVEVCDNVTRNDSLSFIEFTKENLSPNEKSITVKNNSKNTQSGLIEVKKIYGSSQQGKKVTVVNKIYSGDHKDEYNLELNPSILRWYIHIDDWNRMYNNSKLQIECEISSSKLFWSDVNKKTIYFDKSQSVISFGDVIDFVDMLKLEGDRDIISGPTKNEPFVVVFNVFADMDKYVDNKANKTFGSMFGNRKSVSFGVKVDMLTYNALNRIITSSGSFSKVINYNLWLVTTIILIIIHYFDII